MAKARKAKTKLPTASQFATLLANNEMLAAEVATLRSQIADRKAKETFIPLKPAAIDAGMAYDQARNWCAKGLVDCIRDGKRWLTTTVSLIERRKRLSRK